MARMTAITTKYYNVTRAAAVAGALSAVVALGAALLCIGHLGVDVPVLSALGPGGDQAVPVAATIFALGTAMFGAAAWGLLRQARWAWPAGVAVHALGVLSGVGQYRGTVSAVGIVLSLAALVVLLAPAGRGLRHTARRAQLVR